MALNEAAKDSALAGLAAAFPFIALSADGSTEVGSRQSAGWSDTGNGVLGATNKEFTGLAANQPVGHVLLYSASTAGTFGGSIPVTGDATANAAGEYTVTSVTLTLS